MGTNDGSRPAVRRIQPYRDLGVSVSSLMHVEGSIRKGPKSSEGLLDKAGFQ